jgi:predicted transcriptional regulator of viral defense system
MNASEAYATLREVGVPVFETADVATILRVQTSAATMLLNRLAHTGLVSRLRKGQWLIGDAPPNRYALAEHVTAPFPSYVSLQTALYLHGMIDQVPAVVYVVSLSRTQRIPTSVAEYSVHHIAPELFDGFEVRADGTKLATPEKAIFDVMYLSGGRSRVFARLPELELPKRFRRTLLNTWIARIASIRRRSMVETRIAAVFAPKRTR